MFDFKQNRELVDIVVILLIIILKLFFCIKGDNMYNFIALTSEVSEEVLLKDYENSLDFDKVQIGEICLYFNRFARVEYLPLKDIKRAYRDISGLNNKQCCNICFDVFCLVICFENGSASCKFQYESQLEEILKILQKKLPDICFQP